MAYSKWAWRASHTNGAIPISELAEIVPKTYDLDLDGPAVMHPEAAAAMSAWLAEAEATGHGDLRVKYSYRPIDVQRVKYQAYLDRGKAPPIVAVPGTSNHGWAVSVDFSWSKDSTIAWAHRTASRFGYEFDVPSEIWHCTYQGGWKDEEEMSYQEFKEGWKRFVDGKPKPSDTGDVLFGWNAARYAASNPKPGDPGTHTHEVTGTAA
jgi:LAS superfamily LD-carboxypeptidase LdcB